MIPPPNADRGAPVRKPPVQSSHDDRLTQQDTDPDWYDSGTDRHDRWACMATDRVPVPCPRCCRCWSRESCIHRRVRSLVGVTR